MLLVLILNLKLARHNLLLKLYNLSILHFLLLVSILHFLLLVFQVHNASSIGYIDSGASNHMISSPTNLINAKPSLGNLEIQTVNGERLHVTFIGDIQHTLPLNNVFCVPRLTCSLTFVGQLVDENCKVLFSKSGCIVQDQDTGKVIEKGPKCGRLFTLSLPTYPKNKSLFSLF